MEYENLANLSQDQKDEIYETLKYTCAKQIYRDKIAERLTPKSAASTSKKKKVTWAEWFHKRFGEDYHEYVKRKTEEKRNGQGKEDNN